MAKVKLYRRLVKKAEREAQLYTKFLRTVMHSLAKEISKEISAPISKINKVKMGQNNSIGLIVETKKEVDQESLNKVLEKLSDFKFKFTLIIVADKKGFHIMWDPSPRFGA